VAAHAPAVRAGRVSRGVRLDGAPLTARGAPNAARRPRDSQVAIGAWAPAAAALIYIIRESV